MALLIPQVPRMSELRSDYLLEVRQDGFFEPGIAGHPYARAPRRMWKREIFRQIALKIANPVAHSSSTQNVRNGVAANQKGQLDRG